MNNEMIPPVIERRINLLEGTHSFLKGAVEEIKGTLAQILEQNTKVAVIAEKQSNHQLELERAELRIKEIEIKHLTLHTQVSEFISFIRGLTKLAYILWTSLGAVVFLMLIKIMFFLGKTGFIP
jgi:hypothetical protein